MNFYYLNSSSDKKIERKVQYTTALFYGTHPALSTHLSIETKTVVNVVSSIK